LKVSLKITRAKFYHEKPLKKVRTVFSATSIYEKQDDGWFIRADFIQPVPPVLPEEAASKPPSFVVVVVIGLILS